MKEVMGDARRFASASEVPVLLLGPTGAGKTLLARYIHAHSSRRLSPFQSHNFAALSEGIAASTLFGHRRGAFTGAVDDAVGAVAAAGEGTLFLDEITRGSASVQAMLLQILDDGSYRRVGDAVLRTATCRFVAATNDEPSDAISRGVLAEDLYARLEGLELRLPALRERREDIPVLAEWFVAEIGATEAAGRRIRIHKDLADLLLTYEWPHNVRQLRAVLRRIVLNADGATELTAAHVRGTVLATHPRPQRLADFTLPALEDFIRSHGQSKSLAAAALGCHRSSLHRRLDELRRTSPLLA